MTFKDFSKRISAALGHGLGAPTLLMILLATRMTLVVPLAPRAVAA